MSAADEGCIARIYSRVSTDEQARSGYNLDENVRLCQAHAEQHNWTVAGVYTDEGVSGSVPLRKRPGGSKLVRDLTGGEVLLAPALDRIGRSQSDLSAQFEEWIRDGVDVVTLKEQLDMTTPAGRAMAGFLFVIAQLEREQTADRVATAIAARARSGKPWGPPAYGFRKGEDGNWEPCPPEVAVAKRIYRERVEQGRSYSAISKGLEADRVPTRKGGHWTATHVRRILTGKSVRGYYWHGGEWHKGQHPPIIDEASWNAAQKLAVGSKFAPTMVGRIPARHLFTQGMLRCGYCGEAMLPRSEGDRYVCRTRKMLGGDCPMRPIERAAVEVPALRLFEGIALDVDATHQHVTEQFERRLDEVQPLAQRAAREVSDLGAQAERVRGDYRAGRLDADDYKSLRAEIAEESAAAKAEADGLAAQVERITATATTLDPEGHVLRRLAALRVELAARVGRSAESGDVGTLRAAIDSIFEAVYLRPADHPITALEGYEQSVEAVEDRPLYVEPHLRPELVVEYDENVAPLFERVPLRLESYSGIPAESGSVPELHNLTGSGVPE